MALDPSVDIGRKVWRSCTHCPNADGLYLLKSNANLVYVQCPLCHNTWWLDTKFGVQYLINTRVPEYAMNSMETFRSTPINAGN